MNAPVSKRWTERHPQIRGTLSPSDSPLPELTGVPPDRPDSEDPAEPSRARQAR